MRNITMVIPTYNSPEVLRTMLTSLRTNTDWELGQRGRVILVNNGDKLPFTPDVDMLIEAGSNLGWMGGVNAGLKEADTEFFCMANDDLLFPPNAWSFWSKLKDGFRQFDSGAPVGGVAPSSNYVSGCQNAFWHTEASEVEAPYLIGMLAMYQTELLKKLGGLDESLPGGDDLDLSIRVRDAGFRLVCCRGAYVHHIGSQTGRREQPDYWDSQKHQTETMNALIRKHGMKKWYDCWMGAPKAL